MTNQKKGGKLPPQSPDTPQKRRASTISPGEPAGGASSVRPMYHDAIVAFERRLDRARRLRARLTDAEQHHAAEEAETRRLMLNWAQWKSGASISVAVSQAWRLEARGRRADAAIPLLNGEAAEVDAAVDALPSELHQAVVEYWCKRGNVEKKARACHCSVATFYRRLAEAHSRIRALMQARRDQAARVRQGHEEQRARASRAYDEQHAAALEAYERTAAVVKSPD